MQRTRAVSLLGLSYKDVTGGFVYAENLLEHLLEIDREHTYCLILNLRSLHYFKKRYGARSNIRFFVVDVRQDIFLNPLRALKKIFLKIRKDERGLEKMVRKEIQNFLHRHRITLLFFPASHVYPRGLTRVRTIVTVYDLQHIHFPEYFSERARARRDEQYRYIALHADHIISISNYTKDDLVRRYSIPREKIAVIHLGGRRAKETRKVEVPRQYMFYPAAFWPHKNHLFLIEALEDLQSRFPDLHLVFTGVTKKKQARETLEHASIVRSLEHKIHFLGFVEEEELAYIYKHASLLAFPSSFEGFGMPIVEAFEYGIPVIAADNSSITEVVGSAGLLFETNNIAKFVQHVTAVLANKSQREALIQRGRERAKLFSWRKTAEQTHALFDSLDHCGADKSK
jgi:glycosyltransferase involved in cell wall biosynthesis